MSRPLLEVADIFRAHGPAWRDANRGHVSLDQLKVMSAIERCRTAALGGHVARCENAACAYTTIAYNCGRRRVPVRGRAVMTPIAPLIEAFLRETLSRQRGASRHTQELLCPELPAAVRVRCREIEDLTIGADAGADRCSPGHRLPRAPGGCAQKRGRDAQRPAGGDQVVLPLPRIPATGSPGADPPGPGDPVQEDGCAPGSLSAARGVASRARRS